MLTMCLEAAEGTVLLSLFQHLYVCFLLRSALQYNCKIKTVLHIFFSDILLLSNSQHYYQW